jgi:VanZ family protein
MKDSDLSLWRGRIFRYAPLVIWVGVVLFASTGSASMLETSRFIRPLLHFLFPDAAEKTLQIYHIYIRKLAHLTEYALLALFASRALFYSNKKIFRRFWFVFAFASVLLVASIDETNQSYNVARTGSIRDVLLDAAGGAAMILIYYSAAKYRTRR